MGQWAVGLIIDESIPFLDNWEGARALSAPEVYACELSSLLVPDASYLVAMGTSLTERIFCVSLSFKCLVKSL